MKRFLLIPLIFFISVSLSCNMFWIAVRNVPVFFSSPDTVDVKVENPVRPDVRLSALWIGHSTVLIQMDDKVIITDPFLTETAGELARRVVNPGIDIENIPPVNLILISHSHFDHLNFSSLSYLEQKTRRTSLVFPKDLENYLPNYDMDYIRMNNDNGYQKKIIGEESIIDGIKVTTVFAQHMGGRYGLDGYVWGDHAYTGYMLEYNGMTVYFAGDTGYDPEKFKQLGNKFKIDLALIPIGPCGDCRNCGTKNHVFPTDAVYIFKDIKAKVMVPIHYGTLVFAQADPMEPLIALRKIMKEEKLEDKIKVLKIGEQIELIKK
jgi:N-acyl-phosphatidylethanolamine-hydrolysing phospholipase D